MYDNGGSPAFKPDPEFGSSPGAYAIKSGSDFTPSANFLVGLGAVDQNGRMKPAATVDTRPIVSLWMLEANIMF